MGGVVSRVFFRRRRRERQEAAAAQQAADDAAAAAALPNCFDRLRGTGALEKIAKLLRPSIWDLAAFAATCKATFEPVCSKSVLRTLQSSFMLA
jgi:hypothetical protein